MTELLYSPVELHSTREGEKERDIKGGSRVETGRAPILPPNPPTPPPAPPPSPSLLPLPAERGVLHFLRAMQRTRREKARTGIRSPHSERWEPAGRTDGRRVGDRWTRGETQMSCGSSARCLCRSALPANVQLSRRQRTQVAMNHFHTPTKKKNVPASPISPRPYCPSGECDALGRVFARRSRQMHVFNIKRGRVLATGVVSFRTRREQDSWGVHLKRRRWFMQISSATVDHHREAAEYYEVSCQAKIQNIPSWPLSKCDDSSLFIFYVVSQGIIWGFWGRRKHREVSPWATGHCQEYLFKNLMHHQQGRNDQNLTVHGAIFIVILTKKTHQKVKDLDKG